MDVVLPLDGEELVVELHGSVQGVSFFGGREEVARDGGDAYVRSPPDSTDWYAMPHDPDFDDSQLLAAGVIGALLARYEPVILGRCIARLRGSLDAEDVAQDVKLRLLEEFERGKRYGGLLYRVVVHQVIGWTIADHFAGRPTDVPLPDGWEPREVSSGGGDPADEVVSRGWVEWVVSQVDGKDGQICRLRYRDLLEPAQIAAQLGMQRNAVDQALYRCRSKLQELAHA